MAAVWVEHLTKRYRLRSERGRTLKELFLRQTVPASEVHALRDVTFSVEEGESFGVVGANGSGKSTLLKLIAGTTRPTSGRLVVRGRISALLEIGVGFHPDFSGRENAYLTGAILGLSRKQMQRAMPSIEEFADVGPFFDARVKTYSSGMYMRLGFAVAVHVDPDILLIDEVLAVGDEYFQHKCYAKIDEFRARKKTIVFVSHDLNAVKRLCGRALLLHEGSVRASGDVRQVVAAYEESIREREGRALAAPERTAQRWGSRQVEVVGVRILGADASETRVLRSGAPAAIELRFVARRHLPNVAFGVLFHRSDGLAVFGTNTALDGETFPVEPGGGTIRFSAAHLELLDGEYLLDVAATSPDQAETYDYHSKTYRFRVFGASGEIGAARVAHRWEIVESRTAERVGDT